MTELWPSKKAKAYPLEDLMERIESMVREGQTADLRNLVRDLGELTVAVRDLISQMEAKKAYGYDLKASGISKALEEMRSRVEAKKPPQGREVVSGMAEWIARN